MINAAPVQPTVYYDYNTTNNSFLRMHQFLKAKGIKNNAFFLILYDPGLAGVDPRDPHLSKQMKYRILRECMINYWYFIRTVLKIPQEGGAVGSGAPYELSRGNLAMNYMFVYNINQFVEFPRQHGKTVSALCWYLWVFNFAATNLRMLFGNKKHDDSKNNLRVMKNLRDALPSYLQMSHAIGRDGKEIKAPNTAEKLKNPYNNNLIDTLPGARTPGLAEGAGRGATVAMQYYDEFAFLPYNDIVYTAAAPAFSKASENAEKNHVPYGMLITTTPGDLTTREGQFANHIRTNATEWDERYYDLSYEQLKALINANPKSNFMHIRYTYKMLGKGAAYFDKMRKDLQEDWVKIRREVMLEWAKTADNNPFNRDDLKVISAYVKDEPIAIDRFGKAGQFVVKYWDQIPYGSTYPLIIGVDVSSGIGQDSSTMVVVDSQTTKVIATFRSNYITTPEFADLIYQFVNLRAKNAIVNIENNGGFGSSVLQMLIKTSIKPNLYYEIKDRIDEEQFDGVRVQKKAKKCKVYGSTSSKSKRDKLIELLHQRVMHHRDKFSTKELYDELCTMVVKPSGKTEHADGEHDDMIFGYLWALYVFYYGEDLVNRFHLMKTEIYTDDHYDETSYSLEEEYDENEKVDDSVFKTEDEVSQIVDDQMKQINAAKSMTLEDFYKSEMKKEQECLQNIMKSQQGRDAIADAYHIDVNKLNKEVSSGYVDISNDIVKSFYGDEDQEAKSTLTGNLSNWFDKI